MLCNSKMKILLAQIECLSDLKENIDLVDLERALFPNIYRKQAVDSESYYCINNFCALSADEKTVGKALTELEWDGNETRIDLYSKKFTPTLAKIALLVIRSWSNLLMLQFPTIEFDIVMSIDDGTDCEPSHSASATIRFYAIRGGYCYIDHNSLEEFNQPVMIERINRTEKT